MPRKCPETKQELQRRRREWQRTGVNAKMRRRSRIAALKAAPTTPETYAELARKRAAMAS